MGTNGAGVPVAHRDSAGILAVNPLDNLDVKAPCRIPQFT
jgi:hypothetical protein